MKKIKTKKEWDELIKIFGEYQVDINPREFPCFAEFIESSNDRQKFVRFKFVYNNIKNIKS